MIRLALIGDDRRLMEFAAVTARIRGASVQVVREPGELESLQNEFDALVAPSNMIAIETLTALGRAGRHILLEATGGEDSRAITGLDAIARESSARLMIGRPHRFLPSMQTIRASLHSGQLGNPGLVRVHRWRNADAGSPASADALAPDLDLVHWLFGTSPEVVFATESHTAGQLTESTDSRGNLMTHIGFPGGGMAVIDFSDQLPAGDDYFSLSVIGSTGSAIADDHHNQQLVFRGGNPAAVRTDHAPLHRLAMLQDFVDAIVDERDTSDSVNSLEDSARMVAAIRQSLTSRQAVAMGDVS